MDTDQPAALTLYTVGHSNLSAEEFLSILQAHQVRVVVDVRSAPASRYSPHFNRQQLEHFLREQGIAYRFAGEYLGGRPTDPQFYKFQAVPDDNTRREKFTDLVDYIAIMRHSHYQRGIQRLLQLAHEHHSAETGYVAVMCSEANPRECHRHHLIARSLLDPNLKVTDKPIELYHILRTRDAERVRGDEFVDIPTQRPLF